MKIINKILPLLIVLICFSACRKDNDEIIDNGSNTPDPTVTIQTSFNGIVNDTNGEAIEGATVHLGNESTDTDENGYYLISEIANKNGAYLRVTANGYYDAYGSVLPSNEGITYVKFQLKERGTGTVVNSDNPGELEMNDNMVAFQPNSFVDQNGNKYTGDVTVYMDYLDPSAENFGEVMPGDMNATSNDNESGILKSFGMLNVEMFGSNGQALDIDQPAQLNIDIPSDFASDAPATIPMWYFDTDTGLWVEEGTATKVGDHYEATVNHFTLWNCDVFDEAYVLSGQVTSRFPLTNIKVKVTWISANDSRTTHTDDDGYFSGKVPGNELFLVEILDECNNVIASDNVGPLTQDEFLNINVDPNAYNDVLVQGSIQACDGSIVTNGYAAVSFQNGNNHYAATDNQGNFSINLVNCNNETEILAIGIDIENEEKGIETAADIVNNEAQFGPISACGGGSFTRGLFCTLDNGVIIDIPTVNAELIDSSFNAVRFTAVDDQGNGTKAIYSIDMLDWNNDPNNPEWLMTTSIQEFNGPLVSQYTFGIVTSGGKMEDLIHAYEFTADEIEIRDELTGTQHFSTDFRITGLK